MGAVLFVRTQARAAAPLAAALAGLPAGRHGVRRMTLAGLAGIAAGCVALSVVPVAFGVAGYVAPMVVVTVGYALFMTANNTAVMAGIQPDRRGLISGLLSLSRNVGLITGASVMSAVFAFGSGAVEMAGARPDQLATGLRVTFAVAALLAAVALGTALAPRRPQPAARPSPAGNAP